MDMNKNTFLFDPKKQISELCLRGPNLVLAQLVAVNPESFGTLSLRKTPVLCMTIFNWHLDTSSSHLIPPLSDSLVTQSFISARPSLNIFCFRASLGKMNCWGRAVPTSPSCGPPFPSNGWAAGSLAKRQNQPRLAKTSQKQPKKPNVPRSSQKWP